VAEIATLGHNGQGVSFTPDGQYIVAQNYVQKELVFYRFTGNALTETGVHIAVNGYPAGIRIAR
jgi:DNA-binding beta-propeller fold protein YncE